MGRSCFSKFYRVKYIVRLVFPIVVFQLKCNETIWNFHNNLFLLSPSHTQSFRPKFEFSFCSRSWGEPREFPIGNSKKMKIRILAWNFVYVKYSIRIGYCENFRSFPCTLTDIRLLERLDGLYICRRTDWNSIETKISLICTSSVLNPPSWNQNYFKAN
jgi:hypothetical protein